MVDGNQLQIGQPGSEGIDKKVQTHIISFTYIQFLDLTSYVILPFPLWYFMVF